MYKRDGKKYILQKNGDEFNLRDYIEFDLLDEDEILFWNENRTLDYTGAINLAGTWTEELLGQSGAKLATTNLTANRTALAVGARAEIRSMETRVSKTSRLVYEFSANDEIIISTIGQNSGILMESPFFGFINSAYAKQINDPLKVCSCGFVLRAMSLYHNESMEEIASIPVDTRELLVRWDAYTTGAGKVEIYAIKKMAQAFWYYVHPFYKIISDLFWSATKKISYWMPLQSSERKKPLIELEAWPLCLVDLRANPLIRY